MSGKIRKPAAIRKKATAYKMPEPIKQGELLKDTISKKTWKIGSIIGTGGFGAIYSASEVGSSPGKKFNYVIKIEPHENGPLFVERNFYMRNGSQTDIVAFMKSKKLSSLGMPVYLGGGSHLYNGEKYRFLIMERYGKDIWTLFTENGKKFNTNTVFILAIQMLDILEYIHSRGYVHADIKGTNILLGIKRGTESQAYLVDFGLATRIQQNEFKPNPKCAHNGTIVYTSRDAHLGVPTMRGDLEILAYNMLQWLTGFLPWEKTQQPKAVQSSKEAFMNDIRGSLKHYYKNDKIPDELIKFMEYIKMLQPNQQPDYAKCKQMLQKGIIGSNKLNFRHSQQTKSSKQSNKSIDSVSSHDDENEEPTPKKKIAKKSRSSDVSTPVHKNNLVNTSTQTSLEKIKPDVIKNGESKRGRPIKKINYKESLNRSLDLFDESPIRTDSPKTQSKKLVKDEILILRSEKRTVKQRSWKDFPSVANGKGPKVI